MLGIALSLIEMKRNQWRSPGDLREISEKKMLALLAHAKGTTEFYKKRLSSPAAPVRSLDDLPSVPTTSKADVRDRPASFISSAFPQSSLRQTHTSGSTGVQVPLYFTESESSYGIALETHQLTECGAGLFDLQARITHYESAPNLLQRFGIFRCSYLPVQGEESGNLRALSHLRPGIVISYPSILLPLARINMSERRNLKFKMVLAGGEMLAPSARQAISSSFGCPVYDRYGSMESSWAAWECKDGSLHIQDDWVYLEILDKQGVPVKDGQEGSIALTPLWRKAMPLIRYISGDIGSIGGRCRCGRGLRTLKLRAGREDDVIVLPSGRIRSARSINLMDDIRGILAYQIVQESPGLFIFRYVPGTGLGEQGKAEIRRRIGHGCLGEKVQVEFVSLDSIPRGRTGKLRTVISKVRPDARV
jgi:phenylacetate-CoA ligase